jgi:hypothetical protein
MEVECCFEAPVDFSHTILYHMPEDITVASKLSFCFCVDCGSKENIYFWILCTHGGDSELDVSDEHIASIFRAEE